MTQKMFLSREIHSWIALFSLIFIHWSTGVTGKEEEDACQNGEGLRCRQPGFYDWDMEVDQNEMRVDGRYPGLRILRTRCRGTAESECLFPPVKRKGGRTAYIPGVTTQQKDENYYVNTTQWCESIRPCPVHSGTPSTSHNTGEAPNAFKSGARWAAGQVSKEELSKGGVWVKYSYGRVDLSVGFLLFEPCDQISMFIFEGSTDDVSWQELQLNSTTLSSGLQEFKVLHSRTDGPKSFKHYRLRITETKWSAAGENFGSVAIGNFQLCLMDKMDDIDDNHIVSFPPYLIDGHARAFASTRWGRNWNEKFAFQRPDIEWSSEYLYSDGGDLQEPQYVGYSYSIPRIVRKIRIMGAYQSGYMEHHAREFSFEGSDDMQHWTILFEASVSPFESVTQEVEFEVPEDKIKPFKNYRIYVTKTSWSVKGDTGGYLIMRAIRFC